MIILNKTFKATIKKTSIAVLLDRVSGLLGLGVGTLATYAQPGDMYRLYEINQVVTDLAAGYGDYFSFVRDSKADISIVLGDARISLERELADGDLHEKGKEVRHHRKGSLWSGCLQQRLQGIHGQL